MRIRNGDRELHVAVDGAADGPPIVLLHGITSSVATWDWLVPHLADRFRVIRLDFRGHGSSDRTPSAYSMAGYVSDAMAVCEQVAERPAILIGHSLGGGTAIALAQQRPELVRALVLEDPPLTPPGTFSGNRLFDAFRLMRESVPRLQAEGVDAPTLADILRRSPSPTGATFGELLHDDASTAMASSLLALDASVLDPVIEGTSTPEYRPEIALGMPTLVITADPASPDAIALPDAVARLRSVSPQVRILTPAGATHLLHDELTHRDTFLAAVLEFLDELD